MESGLFSKVRVSIGRLELELGLAFQGVKISTFDEAVDAQSWEMMKKVFLEKVWGPKYEKVDFSKVRVRVGVGFSRCENLHVRCPKLGK